jgi:hypothetical protein
MFEQEELPTGGGQKEDVRKTLKWILNLMGQLFSIAAAAAAFAWRMSFSL